MRTILNLASIKRLPHDIKLCPEKFKDYVLKKKDKM